MLNAETRALLNGLACYPVEVEAFDTWAQRGAALRDLLRGRFEAVYAVAGSQLLEGPDHWSLDLLDLVPAPLLYRLADPPFEKRFLTGLAALGHNAMLSVRDHDSPEFLEGAGAAGLGIHYAPGRFDPDGLDAAAAATPLAERDIPFLYVGSIGSVGSVEGYTKRLMPDRLGEVRAISDALLAEPSRSAWRVAADVYRSLGNGLTPCRGVGRALLDLGNRHATARFRHALVGRLAAHDGVLVLDGTAPEGVGAGRARLRGRLSHAEVMALTRRSRVVVATPPYLSTGAVSERVYWSMASGALSAALRTPAMDRHFDHRRHYRCFGRALDGLDAVIEAAGRHPDDLQPVADAGRRHVHGEFSAVGNVKRLFAPLIDIGEPQMRETFG